MKRIAIFILLCSVLFVSSFAMAMTEAELPAPADWSRSVRAPSFSMTTADGKTLTSGNFGAGANLLLVYGRIGCFNTRAFLGSIQPAMSLLKEHGITVLVGVHDNPSNEAMKEFTADFPGIVCGKVSNYYNESGMWTGLEAWNGAASYSITFPAVFLRDASGKLRYCSTGFVSNPLSIVAAAIEMSGGQSGDSKKNGDLNQDGKVNGKDSILLLQYLAGWDVAYDKDAYDINKDGAVNGKDSILLLQYLAGWDSDYIE